MLLNLQINNIALIDQVDISFKDGLNVLSGETGAGKSIIIDALNFVLGAKADKTLIKFTASKCSVSALFSEVNNDVRNSLNDLELDTDEDILLSRSLSLDGKSDCRVNGKVVTLAMLKQVASLLMDIHGQHEHQKLLKENFQLEILDTFAGETIFNLKEDLSKTLASISEIKKQIKEIGGNTEERANTIDFLKYQITEIENANLELLEDERLSLQKTQMLNSGKIFEAISDATACFNGNSESRSITELVAVAESALLAISSYANIYDELSKRLNNVKIELDDINAELDNLNVEETFNEKELDDIENRLNVIKNLKRKYGPEIIDVFKFKENAIVKLDKLLNSEEELQKLLENLKTETEIAISKANKLTNARKEKAKVFESLIVKELESLGMMRARFEIKFTELDVSQLNKNGLDDISFMFCANVGMELMELSKIISGGEMSRLSLGIKNIISSKDNIDAMVFDEVDTGISGAMGQVVAEKMANISRYKQVIVVSHLPQIVAMGDSNYLIEKHIINDLTVTQVRQIENDLLIAEIARLVGGKNNSAYALLHATEMRELAQKYKTDLNKLQY